MIRKMKPTTAGLRQVTYEDYSDITKKKPQRSLTVSLKRHSGRDNLGRVSVRHQGSGAKRLYRLVDFSQLKLNGELKVLAIEYDPYRSARIALIQNGQGKKSYMVAPANLKVGDKINISQKTEVAVGNRMQIKNIPVGTPIFNIELRPGAGGQLVRSAGNAASIIAKDPPFAHIKLPSGEVRKILLECYASVGTVSNGEHNLVTIGKAGRMRHMGIRPTVRGKAMYPAAHPHGGGEGVSPIGLKYPKTKWGKHALGVRTRRNKKTDQYILQRRKK